MKLRLLQIKVEDNLTARLRIPETHRGLVFHSEAECSRFEFFPPCFEEVPYAI